MNKKITTAIIVVIIIFIAVSIFLAFPKIKESTITSAIERANYCEVDSDCVDAGGKCPFGCYVYVNVNEVENISQLIQSYESKCVYGCIANPTVTCENNTCKEVFE